MGILDDVAGLVAGVAGDLVFEDGTLKRASVRAIDAQGRVSATSESVAIKGLVTDYSAFQRAQAGIPSNERKVLILGHGLVNDPAPGDVVAAQGGDWIVQEVSRDPARATFECRAKPAP